MDVITHQEDSWVVDTRTSGTKRVGGSLNSRLEQQQTMEATSSSSSNGPYVNVWKREYQKDLRFFAEAVILPHPDKNNQGEDYCYISRCGRSIGVADGVGGWVAHGIDSGQYARSLCNNAAYAVEEGTLNPLSVLRKAYDNTNLPGSSTLCIATLDKQLMRGANIGDSGYRVFRQNEIGFWTCVEETEEMQHFFNCPKQLGLDSTDTPHDADRYSIAVEEGDVVIMGSDGLFDNVFPDEIIDVLNEVSKDKFIQYAEQLSYKLAFHIAELASKASTKQEGETPFSKNANAHNFPYDGGKRDDITVVAAIIAEYDEQYFSKFELSNEEQEEMDQQQQQAESEYEEKMIEEEEEMILEQRQQIHPAQNPAHDDDELLEEDEEQQQGASAYFPPNTFTAMEEEDTDQRHPIPPSPMLPPNTTTTNCNNQTPSKQWDTDEDCNSPDSQASAYVSLSSMDQDDDDDL